MNQLIEKLAGGQHLTREEWVQLIEKRTPEDEKAAFERAGKVRDREYGNEIYMRGLIEFSNYCKNDCYYCGIRKSNAVAERYRLSAEQILECCAVGYALGFRTFVLQSGEDDYYTDDRMAALIAAIRAGYPDCAITLSLGEKSKDTYQHFFNAGADRYLLRHETADEAHYRKLHPKSLSLANRKQCLFHLKEIGYQVGCGFMVGSPFQSPKTLAEDLLFMEQLNPQMVGIGPFIPHHETPFKDFPAGSVELTLYLIALTRLLLPKALIPATTALGTMDPLGREKGVQAGANVVMPNLSPKGVRGKYLLYDNKICTGDEAAECRFCMQKRMERIGHRVVVSRGDYKKDQTQQFAD